MVIMQYSQVIEHQGDKIGKSGFTLEGVEMKIIMCKKIKDTERLNDPFI